MSCNLCTTKFNFFHKEVGCPNCGLSVCNKCLKQKCKVPNKGNTEQFVCKSCYIKLTSGSTSQDNVILPPDIFLKRLECLENPSAPPITVYKNNDKLDNLRTGLSPIDQKLLDRLEKLKDKGKGLPPTESELYLRLATLKGENMYVEGPSKNDLQNLQERQTSDHEKVDNLLERFVKERDIEFANNPQQEIEARLATLRQSGVRPNENQFINELHDSSSDSEDDVDKITRKIMDEVALEERCSVKVRSKSNAVEDCTVERMDDDELPWCVLCNEDANVRCLDCGGDLYCIRCNKEAHDSCSYIDHRFVEYKKK